MRLIDGVKKVKVSQLQVPHVVVGVQALPALQYASLRVLRVYSWTHAFQISLNSSDSLHITVLLLHQTTAGTWPCCVFNQVIPILPASHHLGDRWKSGKYKHTLHAVCAQTVGCSIPSAVERRSALSFNSHQGRSGSRRWQCLSSSSVRGSRISLSRSTATLSCFDLAFHTSLVETESTSRLRGQHASETRRRILNGSI